LIARVVLAVVLLGCGRDRAPANTPDSVAERFMDWYFVEIDQEKALPLTTGSARATLERELADVKSIRGQGYSAQAAKGKVYYKRTYRRLDEAAGSARMIFDVTVELGRDRTLRHVLLSLHAQEGGQWRVASFTLREGAAPGAPR
jgi:hypothetical protein